VNFVSANLMLNEEKGKFLCCFLGQDSRMSNELEEISAVNIVFDMLLSEQTRSFLH